MLPIANKIQDLAAISMKYACAIFVVIVLSAPANAELLSRMNGQAYYDTLLDITWTADGNLPATQAFGITGIGTTTSGFGAMDWATSQAWITAMNAAGYLGASDWRLPKVVDTGTPGCNLAYSGTDCGWNVDPATGEIAHLYYVTLGNVGGYDPAGVHQDWCDTGMPAPPACLTNDGPFANFLPNHYWTGTEFAPDTTNAWEFNARIGAQNINVKTRISYAWAVRDGDIDSDQDGVAAPVDNCTLVANPSQCDSDGDGFGNHCDGDFGSPNPGNGLTNSQDYVIFRAQLGQPSIGPIYHPADLNCNGFVNAQDYILFKSLLGSAPGPSGLVP